MSIAPGSRFGPYQIIGLVGAGGMGEVYKATDTRLDRTVAIKVLPELFSLDEDRLARFTREARTLAALNHPNVAQIYGVEDAAGHQRALAMEFVEGDDLASRLTRGPVPLDESLAIARQIVDALEAAHDHGIVHRDLKPANIKVRPDGAVKVLDFGLARALDPSAAGSDAVAGSPTITNAHTQAGVVLGSAGYMPPEQAKGRSVDRRADIWAFGVILYELLSGTQPFAANSTSETLARVIEREPEWSRLPTYTPPSILRLLQRCLQKDPRRRLQAIADARLDIDDALNPSSLPVDAPRSRGRERIVAAVAVAAVLSSLAMAWQLYRTRETAPAGAAVSAVITLPDGMFLDGVGPPELAISRDGRTVAFLARGASGLQQLYVRAIDESLAAVVPNSETAEGPFFSPDGRWIAFAVGTSALAGGKPELRKSSLDTQLTQSVAPVLDYFGGVWTSSDELIFVANQPAGLWKVPAGGGTPQNFVPTVRRGTDESERPLAWPELLPGDRAVLVSDWEDNTIAVLDLDSRELTPLGLRGAGARFAPGGYIVYAIDAELRGVRFDPATRRVIGAPVAIAQDVAYARNSSPVFAFSQEGTLIFATGFLRGSRREPMRIVRVSADLKPAVLGIQPQLIGRGFVLSPDGSQLAVTTGSPLPLLIDVKRGTIQKLEDTGVIEASSLAWAPDGRRIAIAGPVATRGSWGVNLRNVDGSGKPEAIFAPEKIEVHLAGWMPGGTLIAFGGRPVQTKMEIMRIQSGKPRDVIHVEPGAISSARVSPDGRWLAFDSTATGVYEIYVLALSGPPRRIPVTAAGGTAPLWSADGRDLWFRRDRAVISVGIESTATTIEFGDERKRFEWDAAGEWAIAPNGDILGMEPVPGAALQREIQLKTRWFTELERLVR